MSNASTIWNYFRGKGLTAAGVAGLMGNLYAESGLSPTNLQNTYEKSLKMTDAEYTAKVDKDTYKNFIKDKAGYGLAQWTYWSRKENLLNYAKGKKASIGDLKMQLDFLYQELAASYPGVLQVLKTTKSVQEASNEVLLKFERPANQGAEVQKKRAEYGQKYYDEYSTTKTTNEGGTNAMKYSSSNPPLQCMMTNSTCYKGTSTMTPKGILWHSTGANNPTLKRYVQPLESDANYNEMISLLGKNRNRNDWNHISVQAGLNAWIGKLADGSITTIQTMPWNYKPWGCGSGASGSCNNGWIQFEICEDNLSDAEYFNAVYQEACELTAYLCKLYNINPNDTVDYNGIKVPTILCHSDSHALRLGSNHGDVMHWFPKYGKSMETVRADVARLMNVTTATAPVEPATEMYRIRKSWDDKTSQKGAYRDLLKAKAACDKEGKEYKVFNNNGDAIYPEEQKTQLDIGCEIKLAEGSCYISGKAVPNWVIKSKLYLREIRKNGDCVISTQKTGAVTGVVAAKYVSRAINSFNVQITTTSLRVRESGNLNAKILGTVTINTKHTVLTEENGWGKIKYGNGYGWISLSYTKKV